jgi:hypothetical protein
MMMSASPGGAVVLVAPATAGRGEVGGLRRSIDKFRGTDTPPRHPSSPQFPACEAAESGPLDLRQLPAQPI